MITLTEFFRIHDLLEPLWLYLTAQIREYLQLSGPRIPRLFNKEHKMAINDRFCFTCSTRFLLAAISLGEYGYNLSSNKLDIYDGFVWVSL